MRPSKLAKTKIDYNQCSPKIFRLKMYCLVLFPTSLLQLEKSSAPTNGRRRSTRDDSLGADDCYTCFARLA